MCWVVYVASEKPLPTGAVAGEGNLCIDSLTPGITEPLPERVHVGPRHLSLPHVYLAHVGGSCGFSCGLDHPSSRAQLKRLIQEQVRNGSRMELICSHVRNEDSDLDFEVTMTPEELPDSRIERGVDAVGYNPPLEYEVFTTEFPLEGSFYLDYPRLVNFVADPAESTYASLDPRRVQPVASDTPGDSPSSDRAKPKAHWLLSPYVIPRWLGLILYAVIVLGSMGLILWFTRD